jgi:dTDP-glucose 4,6-dehydratase
MEALTRDPVAFSARSPHLADATCVDLLQGDVCEPIATNGRADAIFHAATPASREFNEQSPRLMVDTIVEGMRNVLSVAAAAGQPRLFFTSSGAVYGRQPSEVTHLVEDSRTAPDQMSVGNAYHEGKRLAELLGAIATDEGAANVVTGRLFAFVGPHLPVDAHFAVGNFIRDALAGGPVVVEGDGSPFRSYQYAADLVVWMLALLVRGEPGRAYNVGSQDAISIADLADLVARVVGDGVPVEVRGTPVDGRPAERYVPDCQRAEGELHVRNSVPLEEALERTATWHRSVP